VIRLKRAYEPSAKSDGRRILVERLWPRGMTKSALAADAWMKEVAPSPELRTWYGHNLDRWEEFRRRYIEELRANPIAWAPLAKAAKRGTVTFVFAARDVSHNSALVLRDFLNQQGSVPRVGG